MTAARRTSKTRPMKARPVGNKAREFIQNAQASIIKAQSRMDTIDKQAERIDALGVDADAALNMGNVQLARAILLNMRAHAANVRRHEQDAAAAMANAQTVLGKTVRGEWE